MPQEYTPVPGYETDSNYSETFQIPVNDRKIGEIIGQTSTKGEVVSQYLVFKLPRRYDGYDLLNTQLKIYWESQILGDNYGENIDPINVRANDDFILLGWKIGPNITENPGTINFILHAYHETEGVKDYHFKTLPKQYTIFDTLIPGGEYNE